MTDIRSVPLRSGGEMPLLGFGTWQITGEQCYDATRDALDAGYRHVDTATAYRNEREVGRALRDSGLDREAVFVTTKLPPQRGERARDTLQQSLDALGLDALDLWLIHAPPRAAGSVPAWEQLLAARRDGLARAIGVSNYSTAQLDELTGATGETPEVNQIEWSPALYDASRETELRERGVVVEGYSPLRSSDLEDPTLVEVASSYGVSVPQVILRWHVQHEFVVIPKSVHRERIETNADVFDFELDDESVRRIDALGR
jgi:diketogulonate reductase-like aldo/keto reductase